MEKEISKMNQHRYPRIEKLLAVASFLSADGMGFLAFMLSENHDIETGPLWFIAQMLLLCATLLGIDLKAHPILPSVANGGFAPLCGAAATLVAALKTPVARREGALNSISRWYGGAVVREYSFRQSKSPNPEHQPETPTRSPDSHAH